MTRSAGRIVLALAGFVLLAFAAGAREKKKEVVYNEQGEIVKTGMNFGPLPAVAYDADKGFQLGAILNLYQYGARPIRTISTAGISRPHISRRVRCSSRFSMTTRI